MIHEPAITALTTVQDIMDKYEPKHNGAWTSQTLAHHTDHALNHILAFNTRIFEGGTLTPEDIEEVESCLTRCAFILTNIMRGGFEVEVPSIKVTLPPGALD